MTLLELVYTLKNIITNYKITTDNNYTDYQLAFFINNSRNELLKFYLDKNLNLRPFVDEIIVELIQSKDVIEGIDFNETGVLVSKLDYNLFVSNNFSGILKASYLNTSDGCTTKINFVVTDTTNFDSQQNYLIKYTGKLSKITYKNKKIYVKTANLLLESIKCEVILSELPKTNIGLIDLNTDYKIDKTLVNSVLVSVLKTNFNFIYNPTDDTANNKNVRMK